jgi:hypothetical protein
MKISNKFAIFCIILFIGFLLRIFISVFTDINMIGDIVLYHYYALRFLDGAMVVNCCVKNIGYSMFLAIAYLISLFFRSDTFLTVRLIQIIIDLLIAVMIYLIGIRFLSKKAAWYSFILYLLNPITSSYTGFLMPEIITLFIMIVLAYILVLPEFIKTKKYWLLFGFLLGILLFIRMQFLYFVIISIVSIGLTVFKKYVKVLFICICLIGFLIGSAYTLGANYRNFKVISFIPPGSSKYFAINLYANFYSEVPMQELNVQNNNTDKNFLIRYQLFHPTNEYLYYFISNQNKIFFEKFQKDWPIYIQNTFRNILYIWDKEHLFLFVDVFYPADRIPIRIYNIVMIFLFFLGFISYLKLNSRRNIKHPLSIFTIILFLYISSFALTSNETRHSLPFYSLLIFWAGYGLYNVIEILGISKK